MEAGAGTVPEALAGALSARGGWGGACVSLLAIPAGTIANLPRNHRGVDEQLLQQGGLLMPPYGPQGRKEVSLVPMEAGAGNKIKKGGSKWF